MRRNAMKLTPRTMILSAALLFPLVAALIFSPTTPAAAATSPLDFRNAMRQAWEDHITWTRLAIVAILDDARKRMPPCSGCSRTRPTSAMP